VQGRPAVTLGRVDVPARGQRPARAIASYDRRYQRAVADPWQVPEPGWLVVERQQQRRGEPGGGEQRCAQQAPTGLLERDAEFDRREATAAVGLRDGQAGQPQLGAQTPPGLAIPALVSRHLPADLRGR
jgi:hypothetical protein